MTVQEFLNTLDLLGSDLSAWPPEAREEAEAVLASSKEARRQLAAMHEAEHWLGAEPLKGDLADQDDELEDDRKPNRLLRRLSFAAGAVVIFGLGLAAGASPHLGLGAPVHAQPPR